MAKIIKKTMAIFSVMALLSNSLSQNTVQASFQKVGEGVVRIDLEKKYLRNHNSIMLSDDIEVDKMILVDNQEQAGVEIDLLLDANENNYSMLREQQRNAAFRKTRQTGVTNLAQND